MNTKYLLGVALACAMGGLYAANAAEAQGGAAPAVPVAGQAVLGVTVAEQRLIATGFRASKLLKQDVYNDRGDKIGKIDDFVIAPDGTLSIAVIDVGGFLGLGEHRVAIPVRAFAHIAPKAVLPNANKDQLKALPKFEYAA